MKKKYDPDFLNAMQGNPAFWWGPFYVNPRDPRLRVHKFNRSKGWTLNFGNPLAWLIVSGIAIVVVIGLLF
ncbi:hypothetical protein [Mangrovibacterium diazotrophicum]|uniref:hypothetical protein n=1 Tax=Mangrovibacterium diazotrophicum TaxID=1261403 RepID=UPI000E731F1B|nr:hypothetical protein [Mangrovibacterium diazotrophicum]